MKKRHVIVYVYNSCNDPLFKAVMLPCLRYATQQQPDLQLHLITYEQVEYALSPRPSRADARRPWGRPDSVAPAAVALGQLQAAQESLRPAAGPAARDTEPTDNTVTTWATALTDLLTNLDRHAYYIAQGQQRAMAFGPGPVMAQWERLLEGGQRA